MGPRPRISLDIKAGSSPLVLDLLIPAALAMGRATGGSDWGP